jgi:Xaa-Pro aminopeptidase
MKSDLDRLMTDRQFDAILVTGGTHHNPPMYYLANGVSLGEGSILVKKRGADPILFVSGMERDEAAKSGLPVVDLSKYNYLEILKEEKGDRLRASARRMNLIFQDAGVTGTVAAMGQNDIGAAYRLLDAISELNPAVNMTGEFGQSIFSLATATKDETETKRIRAVGKKTMSIVAGTQEFLTSHRAKNGYLVKKDSSRLTVGDVKRRIREMHLEQNVVDTDFIFAIGRDAGVPHSRGNDRDSIALGKTIVYDIFPQEAGGGYYYDFTRTWCVGYAPPEVEKVYEDVLGVFKQVMKALKPGELCNAYQKLAADYFEKRGHPTIQTNPQTTDGYVHSLGHGIGLFIHESPSLSDFTGNDAKLDPGVVVTVEPGLYYPEKGFGVRIEDSVWLNPKTLKFETLAKYPYDLVLPVKEVGRKR